MRLALVVAAATAALAPAASAATTVGVQFDAFGPAQVAILPGETVEWNNVSPRAHTVTADDGSFDSGDLPVGAVFSRAFAAAGSYAYHCTLHPTMTGEVDVTPVLLDPLPVAAVPAGDHVRFGGRTADASQPVRVERALPDGGFGTIATATPAADGTWSVAVAARDSGDYRAASAAGASLPRRLLVSDRKVEVRRTRHGLAVSVTPALPYGRVVLQLRLRDRFGWWPTRRARLDYVSNAAFRVHRRTRARVVLVDRDGWTVLATSRVVRFGPARPHRRRPAGPTPPMPPMPMSHHGGH